MELLEKIFPAVLLVCWVGYIVYHVRRAYLMRNPPRTSWMWCPKCRYDLNGPKSKAPVTFDEEDGQAHFRCPACGTESHWDCTAPAPLLLVDPVRIPIHAAESRVEIDIP